MSVNAASKLLARACGNAVKSAIKKVKKIGKGKEKVAYFRSPISHSHLPRSSRLSLMQCLEENDIVSRLWVLGLRGLSGAILRVKSSRNSNAGDGSHSFVVQRSFT